MKSPQQKGADLWILPTVSSARIYFKAATRGLRWRPQLSRGWDRCWTQLSWGRTTFISRYGHIERTFSLCNSKCPTTKAVEHNTPARQMSADRLRSQNHRHPVLLHPNQEDSPEKILATSTSGNSASFADLPKNARQTKAGKSSHQSVQTLESQRDQK